MDTYMGQQQLTNHADVPDIGPLSIPSTFRDPNLLACTEIGFVVVSAVVQHHMCSHFDLCCLLYSRRGIAAGDDGRQGLYKEWK